MLKNNIALLRHGYGFHTTCGFNSRPGKVMRKIMGESKKKKYYLSEDKPVLPTTASIFGKTSMESRITGNSRRSNVLNKLFMRHITDIMATGEYSKDILGLGIEVNQVKISPDYRFLRVYWIAKESVNNDEVEDLLKKNAGHLRHELSVLRVMGQVPNIVFVKDKTYWRIAEVHKQLKLADFGDDYEPPDFSDQFKTEFEILTSLDTDLKAKLVKQELEFEEDTTPNDIDALPPMPQNVLGLNHADILKRVKKGMSISKAPHRSEDTTEWVQWSEFKTTQHVNQDPVTFATNQEQRNAFKAFLQQRQILKMKQRRMDKNWMAESDYLEEEVERHGNRIQFDEEDMMSEEDYILEDKELIKKSP